MHCRLECGGILHLAAFPIRQENLLPYRTSLLANALCALSSFRRSLLLAVPFSDRRPGEPAVTHATHQMRAICKSAPTIVERPSGLDRTALPDVCSRTWVATVETAVACTRRLLLNLPAPHQILLRHFHPGAVPLITFATPISGWPRQGHSTPH